MTARPPQIEPWLNILSEADYPIMFDVLEHIPDLGFLPLLKSRYVAISVPYCRYRELGVGGDAWFQAWQMRLPAEALINGATAS